MRTGEKDVFKNDVIERDPYLKSLHDIVESRNTEIAKKFSIESTLLKRPTIEIAAIESQEEPADVLSIILLNLAKMKKYYDWSITQAIITFFIAAASCVVGILLIVFAFAYSVTEKVALDKTIITAIGGLVTELFAGTTLIVYKSSLKQMNFYHKSLHEDQRLLSSVDLLCRFSNDKNRDKMLQTIICSSMQISIAAAVDDDDVAEPVAAKQ